MIRQRYINPDTGRLNKTCIDCGILLARLGTKRCKDCNGKVTSARQMGDNNPNYVHGKTGNTFCLDCGKEIDYTHKRCSKCNGKQTSIRQTGIDNPCYKHGRTSKTVDHHCPDCGQKVAKEGNRCKTCAYMRLVGENNPSWRGGISFEPYPSSWGRRLKRDIRERDNHVCQECGIPESDLNHKLCVHHIDYDKNSTVASNLISLCRHCHSKLAHRPEWAEPKYKEITQCCAGI